MVDELMEYVRHLADRVVASPPERRDAQFGFARKVAYEAALGVGMGEVAARDAGRRIESWTCTLAEPPLSCGGPVQGQA